MLIWDIKIFAKDGNGKDSVVNAGMVGSSDCTFLDPVTELSAISRKEK